MCAGCISLGRLDAFRTLVACVALIAFPLEAAPAAGSAALDDGQCGNSLLQAFKTTRRPSRPLKLVTDVTPASGNASGAARAAGGIQPKAANTSALLISSPGHDQLAGIGAGVAAGRLSQLEYSAASVLLLSFLPGANKLLDNELLLPFAIVACTAFVAVLVCLLGYTGAPESSTSDEAHRAPRGRESDDASHWLYALTVSTCGVLVLQIVLGSVACSLSLLADSAHTMADVVGYAFATHAERAKRDFAAVEGRRATAAWIDVFSAVLSLVVVLVPTVSAMREAACRLGWNVHGAAEVGKVTAASGNAAETDFRLMGGALFFFAVVSMVVNLVLLWMHTSPPKWDPLEPAADGLSAKGACPEPLAEPEPADKASADSAQPASPLEVPPPPLPPPPSAEASTSRRERRPRAKQGWSSTTVLHMAFHPGCCSQAVHGDASDRGATFSSTPAAGQGDALQEAASSPVQNLNVYGALLHVATDVVRSIVIFVAGVLVLCGVLPDAGRADAICAFVVGGCVLLGSAAMVCSLVQRLASMLFG